VSTANPTSPGAIVTSFSSPSFPSFIPRWVQAIFDSTDPTPDSASTALEAYIAEAATVSLPTKVPLGHERLKFGLGHIQQNKTAWLNYVDMDPAQRGIVDDVAKFAKT